MESKVGRRLSTRKSRKHGELLEALFNFSGLTQEEFSQNIGWSRTWLRKSFKDERILPKNLITICRAYNIPMEYWEGKYELPLRAEPLNSAKEPDGEYVTRAKTMEQENNELRRRLDTLQMELIQSQKEIIELKDQVRQYELQR